MRARRLCMGWREGMSKDKIVAIYDDIGATGMWRLVATEHGGEIWRKSPARRARWAWVFDVHIETYNLDTDGAKLVDLLKRVVASIKALNRP